MGTFILKRRYFTQYDDTDRLKQMKDSDILAEKAEKGPGIGGVVSGAAGGAIAGAGVGAAVGAVRGIAKRKAGVKFLPSVKSAGKAGAIIGGTILAAKALNKKHAADEEVEFYNDRLEYAQNQARRREKKDWKQNMTQRDGYSY